MSSYPDEETRAALWRQQTLNRIAYKRNVWLSLRAPPEPRQAVLDGQKALLLASADLQAATDPKDDP